jgi:hypothetical protein
MFVSDDGGIERGDWAEEVCGNLDGGVLRNGWRGEELLARKGGEVKKRFLEIEGCYWKPALVQDIFWSFLIIH